MRVDVQLNDDELALLSGYNRSTTMGIKKPGELQRELLSDMENIEEKRMVSVPEDNTSEVDDVVEVSKDDAPVGVRADFLSRLSELAKPDTNKEGIDEGDDGYGDDEDENGYEDEDDGDGVILPDDEDEDDDNGVLPDDEEGDGESLPDDEEDEEGWQEEVLPDDDEEDLQDGVLPDDDDGDLQGVTFSEDVTSEEETSEEETSEEEASKETSEEETSEEETSEEETSGISLEDEDDSGELPEDEDEDEDEGDSWELPADEDEDDSGELPADEDEDEDASEELPEDDVEEEPESTEESNEPASPRSTHVVAENPVSRTPRNKKVARPVSNQSAGQPSGYSTPSVSLYDFILSNGGSMLIEDVKKYYPIDEVKKALNLGKIYRFGNKVGV